MKNNYIQVEFLSSSKLSTINKILELTGESDWESGLETFIGDPKTKNNIELKNKYFKQKISSIVYDVVNNCQKLHEYCFPQAIDGVIVVRTPTKGYYNTHTDNGLNGHYSVTLFLSDPEDYDGGELCLFMNGEEKKIKLKAGEAIIYETGIPHRVNEVTRGHRDVIVFWIKSAIKDPFIRELRYDLTQVSLDFGEDKNYEAILTHPEFAPVLEQTSFKLNSIINKLIRRYADL